MEKEVYCLQQAFQANGYPVKVIETLLKEKRGINRLKTNTDLMTIPTRRER